MSSPNPLPTAIVRVAVVGGAAMAVLILLWVFEVVTLELFIGGLVLVAVLETGMLLSAIRRFQQGDGGVPRSTTATSTAPADPGATPPTGPGGIEPGAPAPGADLPREVDTTRERKNQGYDPMEGLPGVGDGR